MRLAPTLFALALALSGGCTFAPVVRVDTRAAGPENVLVDRLLAESAPKPAPVLTPSPIPTPTPAIVTPAPAAPVRWTRTPSGGTMHRDTTPSRGSGTMTRDPSGTTTKTRTRTVSLDEARRDPTLVSDEDVVGWMTDVIEVLSDSDILQIDPTATTRPLVSSGTSTATREAVVVEEEPAVADDVSADEADELTPYAPAKDGYAFVPQRGRTLVPKAR